MIIIKKSTNNKCWRGCGKKGSLLHSWCEYKLVQPLWRTLWRLLQIRNYLYGPAIPLPGMYLERTLIQKDTRTPIFIAALFTITETWKQTKCPLGRWMNKEDVCVCVCVWREREVHRQWNTTQPLKEWNNAICSSMVATRDEHTKWSKSDKDK